MDYSNDGKLEALEIEVAILKLYNIINKRLPGWQNPPTRAQIRAALKVFDIDGNGYLDKTVRAHVTIFFCATAKRCPVPHADVLYLRMPSLPQHVHCAHSRPAECCLMELPTPHASSLG